MKKELRVKTLRAPGKVELYLPAGPGKFPLICTTPILGRLVLFEDLFLERSFARYFAECGFASALIDRPIFQFENSLGIGQIPDYLEASVARNEQALMLLEKEPEVDASRTGTFGISFGAVVNTLWAETNPRLAAHVFALGGGNLADICVSSRDPLMRSQMSAALLAAGGDKNRLRELLAAQFKRDPIRTAGLIPKDKVLLVLALFDRVIHINHGLDLRRVMGNPATLFLPLGHYTSILAAPLLKRRVAGFFRQKLAHQGN